MVRWLWAVVCRLRAVMCRLQAMLRRLWGVVCRLWGVSHSGRNQQKRVSPVGKALSCPTPLSCAERDARSMQESA